VVKKVLIHDRRTIEVWYCLPKKASVRTADYLAPQMCRSTNRQVDPEVWFRVVHLAKEGLSGTPVGPYREQMVEIALGPKGAFENGNIGALRRRVPSDKVVSAALPSRGSPKPPRGLKTPRVVELLRKAIEWQTLLESGEMISQADIARREGVSRARVTQIMGMLRLAPEIQERILSMANGVGRPSLTERILRPFKTIAAQRDQIREFQGFLA